MDTETGSRAEARSTEEPWRGGFWSGRSALLMPAVLLGVAAFLIVGVFRMAVAEDAGLFGPTAFPLLTAGGCVVVALLLVISILRRPEDPGPGSNWRSVAIVVGTLVLFVLLLETAGWIIAAGLLFAGVATGLGGKRYGVNVLAGFALSSVIQLIFVGLLGLSLPAGVWGWF